MGVSTCCCCAATIGQLSAGGGHCPLRRVGCPARSQPAWAGLGWGSPACRRESDGSGRPLGVGRGPLPSPFCGCFSPTTRPSAGSPPRQQTLRPPLALRGAVCLNQCAFWNCILLNPAGVLHVKSQGQVDAHSGRLSSSPKLLQAVKPTTAPPHEGPRGHVLQPPDPLGPGTLQEGGRGPGIMGLSWGRAVNLLSVGALTFSPWQLLLPRTL